MKITQEGKKTAPLNSKEGLKWEDKNSLPWLIIQLTIRHYIAQRRGSTKYLFYSNLLLMLIHFDGKILFCRKLEGKKVFGKRESNFNKEFLFAILCVVQSCELLVPWQDIQKNFLIETGKKTKIYFANPIFVGCVHWKKYIFQLLHFRAKTFFSLILFSCCY